MKTERGAVRKGVMVAGTVVASVPKRGALPWCNRHALYGRPSY